MNPALITAIAGLVTAIGGVLTAVKAHARATTANDNAKEAATLATGAQKTADSHIDKHITGGNPV
jgi:hypothetical protein